MTLEEARLIVAQYNQENTPARPAQPVPPGLEGIRPELQDAASTLYGNQIMSKKAGELTPPEREYLRASIAAWRSENE